VLRNTNYSHHIQLHYAPGSLQNTECKLCSHSSKSKYFGLLVHEPDERYQHFQGMCCLNLQGKKITIWQLVLCSNVEGLLCTIKDDINIPIYIQQDTTLHSLFYLKTALCVSGGTTTCHQERKQLYLQRLVFVTPLLLSAAIAAGSCNSLTNTRCCRYSCLCS